MNYIYTFFISFILVFLAELGDKTQLLVLSFSTKDKAKNILLGVAIGTFFSHGMAIIFGSRLGSFENEVLQFYLELFTCLSFLLFGILGFIPKKDEYNKKSPISSLFRKISNIKINYIFLIAINIVLGEIGDKTFLASLGLGIKYPTYKISLILGSIAGMVSSNSIALFFGKFLGNKFSPKIVEFLSNLIFIVFGILGLISIFF